MQAEVLAAIVAAAVALVVAGARELIDSWRRSGHERRETEIGYLRPLRNACRELLRRLEDIDRRLRDGEALNGAFQQLRSWAKEKEGRFYAECNDAWTWHASTLYLTARYVGCVARIRAQLPLSRIDGKTNWTLEAKTDAVQRALGGTFGLWEVHQESIGQLVMGHDEPLSYREFLLRLVDDFASYTRLFDFYSGISDKRESELTRTRKALEELLTLLEAILLGRLAWTCASAVRSTHPRTTTS